MRCSGWSSLAISACSALALVLAAPAGAHVVATPSFITTDSSATLSLTTPNERDVSMTGFSVTVPDGFVIENAHATAPWQPTIDESTVSWSGSTLPAGGETEFRVQLSADGEPGPAEIEAEQLYPGGEVVRWPVAITVLPGDESPSQNLALAGVIGLVGLLVVAAVAVPAWRRRARSLQEK